MGLPQEGSAGLNDKLCEQSTPQISTSQPKARPICTPSMDAPKLRSNKTTRNSLGYFTTNTRGTKAQDPKKYWNIPLLCTRCGLHYMLPTLNTLADQQSSPTKNTEAAITCFLDYAATNPSANIQYKYSDMILHIDSDASYLSEPRARSCTGGHYYLSSLPTNPKKSPNLLPPANGPIHTECRILKHVVASAAEVEVRGLFHNGQTAVLLRITLHELGFTQPPTSTKQTTWQPKASSMLQLDKKCPRQCTCNFIG